MKTFIALGAVALLSLSLATPASAVTTYEVSPLNKAFTAVGTTSLTKGSINLTCTAHFTGKTTAAGLVEITKASFTGNVLCGAVKDLDLPWVGTASTATKVTFAKVSVSASLFGTCGPSSVPVTITKGAIAFSKVTLTPNCVVNGSGIKTTPVLSIIKKP